MNDVLKGNVCPCYWRLWFFFLFFFLFLNKQFLNVSKSSAQMRSSTLHVVVITYGKQRKGTGKTSRGECSVPGARIPGWWYKKDGTLWCSYDNNAYGSQKKGCKSRIYWKKFDKQRGELPHLFKSLHKKNGYVGLDRTDTYQLLDSVVEIDKTGGF